MEKMQRKREREKKLVSQMIAYYCRKKHHPKSGLCKTCEALDQYAKSRSDHCPMMAEKTFCSTCKVHCYKAEMRDRIRQVMRFSGKRMLLHHPVAVLSHLADRLAGKKKVGNE